jgi:predicted phosphate transport protein (TIGR00153 family)
MVRFLIPRDEKFFDRFDEVATILERASGKLLEMVTAFDRLAERSADLKQEEHAGDLVVEQIIRALDRSFITPLDREDIHALAASLDDVLDDVEETAYRFRAFRVDGPTPQALDMVRIIRDACGHVATAVRLIRSMRELDRVQIAIREIIRLENEADVIYRDVEAELFAHPPESPSEIVRMITWRELYGWLEQTVDACRATANVISGIVIKNS